MNDNRRLKQKSCVTGLQERVERDSELTHSIKKVLLSTHYMFNTVLDAKIGAENKSDNVRACPLEAYILVGCYKA